MLLDVLISDLAYKNKPDSDKIKIIKKNFATKDSKKTVTIKDLAKYIKNGHSFIPSLFDGSPKNVNFRSSVIMAIDIDNDSKKITTIDDVLSIAEEYGLKISFYYETYSSTDEIPRYRIVFILDKPVTSVEQYKEIITTIIALFPNADGACNDPSRTFYGTNKKVTIVDENSTNSLDYLLSFTDDGETTSRKKTHINLIKNFDLLSYMKLDNTVKSENPEITYFSDCCICGHNDDLRYYKKTNTFSCFGAHGNVQGNIINYLMARDKISKTEAWDKFKYEILGMDKNNIEITEDAILNIINDQLKENNLLPITSAPWIMAKKNLKGEDVYSLSCPILAQYICETIPHLFIKSNFMSDVLMYFYVDNYYRLFPVKELDGLIKCLIPLDIQASYKIKEVRELIATQLRYTTFEELNSVENIINFNNGILNLDTMELVEHSPNYKTINKIPCNYVENIEKPKTGYFDKFLDDLTNGNVRIKNLFLQAIGVVISNVDASKYKTSIWLYGPGNTGKSVIKNLIIEIVGSENYSGISLTDLEKDFGPINMLNKRMVGSNDESYVTIRELKEFKKGTGGDHISSAFKFGNNIDFKFKGLFWFCSNTIPKFGGDKGDWVYDRFTLIKCTNVIPEDKRDKLLLEHLLEEKEYIVNLSIQALKKTIENGYRFDIPDECKKLKEQFKVDNNSFLRFFNECCKLRKHDVVIKDTCTTKKVFDVYKAWCKDNNNGHFERKCDVKNILINLGLDEQKKTKGGFIDSGRWFYAKFTIKDSVKKEYHDVYYGRNELVFDEEDEDDDIEILDSKIEEKSDTDLPEYDF